MLKRKTKIYQSGGQSGGVTNPKKERIEKFKNLYSGKSDVNQFDNILSALDKSDNLYSTILNEDGSLNKEAVSIMGKDEQTKENIFANFGKAEDKVSETPVVPNQSDATSPVNETADTPTINNPQAITSGEKTPAEKRIEFVKNKLKEQGIDNVDISTLMVDVSIPKNITDDQFFNLVKEQYDKKQQKPTALEEAKPADSATTSLTLADNEREVTLDAKSPIYKRLARRFPKGKDVRVIVTLDDEGNLDWNKGAKVFVDNKQVDFNKAFGVGVGEKNAGFLGIGTGQRRINDELSSLINNWNNDRLNKLNQEKIQQSATNAEAKQKEAEAAQQEREAQLKREEEAQRKAEEPAAQQGQKTKTGGTKKPNNQQQMVLDALNNPDFVNFLKTQNATLEKDNQFNPQQDKTKLSDGVTGTVTNKYISALDTWNKQNQFKIQLNDSLTKTNNAGQTFSDYLKAQNITVNTKEELEKHLADFNKVEKPVEQAIETSDIINNINAQLLKINETLDKIAPYSTVPVTSGGIASTIPPSRTPKQEFLAQFDNLSKLEKELKNKKLQLSRAVEEGEKQKLKKEIDDLIKSIDNPKPRQEKGGIVSRTIDKLKRGGIVKAQSGVRVSDEDAQSVALTESANASLTPPAPAKIEPKSSDVSKFKQRGVFGKDLFSLASVLGEYMTSKPKKFTAPMKLDAVASTQAMFLPQDPLNLDQMRSEQERNIPIQRTSDPALNRILGQTRTSAINEAGTKARLTNFDTKKQQESQNIQIASANQAQQNQVEMRQRQMLNEAAKMDTVANKALYEAEQKRKSDLQQGLLRIGANAYQRSIGEKAMGKNVDLMTQKAMLEKDLTAMKNKLDAGLKINPNDYEKKTKELLEVQNTIALNNQRVSMQQSSSSDNKEQLMQMIAQMASSKQKGGMINKKEEGGRINKNGTLSPEVKKLIDKKRLESMGSSIVFEKKKGGKLNDKDVYNGTEIVDSNDVDKVKKQSTLDSNKAIEADKANVDNQIKNYDDKNIDRKYVDNKEPIKKEGDPLRDSYMSKIDKMRKQRKSVMSAPTMFFV